MADTTEQKKIRVGGLEYTIGDSATCPDCGKRFICKKHMYMNQQWYKIWRERGMGLGCG